MLDQSAIKDYHIGIVADRVFTAITGTDWRPNSTRMDWPLGGNAAVQPYIDYGPDLRPNVWASGHRGIEA